MSRSNHIGYQVIELMDRLGVSPLTRNYHLFYNCIANSDHNLRRAVRNLGRNPTQQEVDQVIEEYCPEAVDSYMMRKHQEMILNALDELGTRLQHEQSEMSNFNGAVDRVAEALTKSVADENISVEILMRVAGALGDAGKKRSQSGSRMLSRMVQNRTEITALKNELVKARQLANTDPLTGLANRRSFDDRISQAFGGSMPFSLIIADIDHFKRINDTFGHAAGDYVLKAVAATLKQSVREGTFIARTGGEEFAILVPGASDRDTMIVAERLRSAIEAVRLNKDSEPIRVTISLGAALSHTVTTSNMLYEAADLALYRSKNAGRNRTTLHDGSEDDPSSNRYQLYGR